MNKLQQKLWENGNAIVRLRYKIQELKDHMNYHGESEIINVMADLLELINVIRYTIITDGGNEVEKSETEQNYFVHLRCGENEKNIMRSFFENKGINYKMTCSTDILGSEGC